MSNEEVTVPLNLSEEGERENEREHTRGPNQRLAGHGSGAEVTRWLRAHEDGSRLLGRGLGARRGGRGLGRGHGRGGAGIGGARRVVAAEALEGVECCRMLASWPHH